MHRLRRSRRRRSRSPPDGCAGLSPVQLRGEGRSRAAELRAPPAKASTSVGCRGRPPSVRGCACSRAQTIGGDPVGRRGWASPAIGSGPGGEQPWLPLARGRYRRGRPRLVPVVACQTRSMSRSAHRARRGRRSSRRHRAPRRPHRPGRPAGRYAARRMGRRTRLAVAPAADRSVESACARAHSSSSTRPARSIAPAIIAFQSGIRVRSTNGAGPRGSRRAELRGRGRSRVTRSSATPVAPAPAPARCARGRARSVPGSWCISPAVPMP